MVYREIAAHLRQVEGVETGLYPRRSLSSLITNQSWLWIQYSQAAGAKVGASGSDLAYYQDRYGAD